MGCCQSDVVGGHPQGLYGVGSKDIHAYRAGVAGAGDIQFRDAGNKKALLIGINYRGKPFELRGCINDVHTVKAFLKLQGWPTDPAHLRCLTEDEQPAYHPNKQAILEGLKWLMSGVQAGDSLFLLFSGHGHQVKDEDGDEIDGKDEVIVPLNFKAISAKEMITDDVLFKHLVTPLPKNALLTCIMDCCHSGTILDLPYAVAPRPSNKATQKKALFRGGGPSPYNYVGGNNPLQWRSKDNVGSINLANVAAAARATNATTTRLPNGLPAATIAAAAANGGLPGLGGAAGAAIPPNYQSTRLEKAKRHTGGQVVMFSGCKDEQTSADISNVGSFNSSVGPGGAGGACLNALISQLAQKGSTQSYIDILQGMRKKLEQRGFSQIPQISSALQLALNDTFSILSSGAPTQPIPGSSGLTIPDVNGIIPQNPLLALLLANGIQNGEIGNGQIADLINSEDNNAGQGDPDESENEDGSDYGDEEDGYDDGEDYGDGYSDGDYGEEGEDNGDYDEEGYDENYDDNYDDANYDDNAEGDENENEKHLGWYDSYGYGYGYGY